MALLLDQTLAACLRTQHVITIKASSTVDQTLRVLAAHRILSAPVVSDTANERVTGTGDDAEARERIKDVVGFIDIRDILSSFLQEIDLVGLREAKMLKRMRILEEQGQRFATKSINGLKSLGSDGWFYNREGAAQTSLHEIIQDGFLHPKATKNQERTPPQAFGGSRSRPVVHRLALFDTEGQLTNIVSQSDVIKYIYENLDGLGDLADRSVTDLGFVRGTVITVRPDTPALDAMMLMEAKSISAVAVVNAQGAIIGNFSISELRTIMAEHFGSLALPVGEFLALEHGTEYAGYAITSESSGNIDAKAIDETPGARFAHDRVLRRRESHPGYEVGQTLITCSLNASLAEVLDKIVANRLHRVYICNDELVPCGVITLTDVLNRLVESK